MSAWKRIAIAGVSLLALGLAPIGAAFAQVKVTAATPASAYQGTIALDVVVSGGGFNNSAKVWFNESRIDWLRPLVVCEGSFDVLAVHEHYTNVASPWTCTPKLEMLNLLKKCVSVVVAFDSDVAGQRGYQKIMEVIGNEIAVTQLALPDGFDCAEMDPDSLRDALAFAGVPL